MNLKCILSWILLFSVKECEQVKFYFSVSASLTDLDINMDFEWQRPLIDIAYMHDSVSGFNYNDDICILP